MLEKVADAASMLWQALDSRERFLILYAGVVVGLIALSALAAGERRRREDELADRVADRLEARLRR